MCIQVYVGVKQKSTNRIIVKRKTTTNNRKKNDYRPIDSNSKIDSTLIANFNLFFGWLEQTLSRKKTGKATRDLPQARQPRVLALASKMQPAF